MNLQSYDEFTHAMWREYAAERHTLGLVVWSYDEYKSTYDKWLRERYAEYLASEGVRANPLES